LSTNLNEFTRSYDSGRGKPYSKWITRFVAHSFIHELKGGKLLVASYWFLKTEDWFLVTGIWWLPTVNWFLVTRHLLLFSVYFSLCPRPCSRFTGPEQRQRQV